MDFLIDLIGISSAIKSIAIFFSVIILSYAGIVLITSKDPVSRNEWKEIAKGVLIGISVLFLGPVISSALTGGGYCGP
ncbi:hypothetical protein KKB44_04055 [Candidatus Micrarchaeota archaeon]|nr:hypothetical protein [Candidatus Micrarchaeota archaeon]